MVVDRLDGIEKVTGKGIYVADMHVEGTLVGKILRSEVAYARIKRIMTEKAAGLSGVFAVITGKDFPDVKGGRFVRDERIMAREKIRYIGEPVAAVAAIDEETAEQALNLIELELEEMPAIFTPEEGLAPDAPLIHEDWQSHWTLLPMCRDGNIDGKVTVKRGDIEAGFAESDVIVEDEFDIPLVHHAPMEPKTSLAYYDLRGKLTVWTGGQASFSVRRGLASFLQLPMSRIRVIGLLSGGTFGGKTQAITEPIAAMLAMKTMRYVKIEMSRHDDFCSMNPRHSMKIRIKTGARKDGTLVARQARILVNAGAYDIFGINTTSQVVTLVTGPYRFEHLDIEGICVYTNRVPCGACRGPGGPPAHFAAETQMDRIARELGMNPFELRRKNALRAGDKNTVGQIVAESRYVDILDRLQKEVAKHLENIPHTPGKARGIGIAGCFWGMSGYGTGATVRMNEDGTVVLAIGGVEVGTGVTTAMAMLVAEELGIPVKNITVISGDTDACPFDGGAVGSRTTQDMGTAVVRAAREVKKQLLSFAGSQLGVDQDQLVLADSKIAVRNDPERKITFDKIALSRINTPGGGPIMASASTAPAKPDYDRENVKGHTRASKPFFAFGAQAVAVDVDRVTGKVDVCKVVAVHDVGKAVYPLGVEGQIEGGVTTGLGYALSEEAIFEQGRILNPNLLDYRIPTMLDVPQIIPVIIEKPDARVPEDIRGVGEPPTLPTVAAVANAVFDAVGVRVNTLPFTPERVYRAMTKRTEIE